MLAVHHLTTIIVIIIVITIITIIIIIIITTTTTTTRRQVLAERYLHSDCFYFNSNGSALTSIRSVARDVSVVTGSAMGSITPLPPDHLGFLPPSCHVIVIIIIIIIIIITTTTSWHRHAFSP